jgi:DNA-binding transcriptional LysR family regulator
MADSSLVARRVSAVEMHLYAAPAYLARRGTPRATDDAGAHAWVCFRGWRRGPFALPAGGARLVADDFFFVREALRAGAGLGVLPTFLAQADLAAGQLVRVLPRWSESAGSVYFVYPRARHVPRKVTAFRDLLIETLASRPLAPRTAAG